MSQFYTERDLADVLNDLKKRVAVLEMRQANPVPSYTTTARPAASSAPNLIIHNTTTGALQWSNGSAWANV